MRVQVVDPSAYTPPYDHALCAALARAGAEVELVTGPFPYGSTATLEGYTVREFFYRRAWGPAGSRRRRLAKLLEHLPAMLAYRRHALAAQVVHFQWLTVQPLDRHLLPRRPTVLTAHDLLPREPRPLQVRGQRRLYESVDAVVVHSRFGRRQLVERLGVEPAKVRVIPHGAFEHLTRMPAGELPPELAQPSPGRSRSRCASPSRSGSPAEGTVPASEPPLVVMFFGLLRPYKGIELLLEAWRRLPPGGPRAELWIVGRPRMAIDRLLASSPPGVRWVTRFVSDRELAACFRRAQVVVLPYLRTERFDFSGVLATALAFARPIVLSDVGAFSEVAELGAAQLVPAGEVEALTAALAGLLGDPERRRRLAQAARRAAEGAYSWRTAAELTLALYRELVGEGRPAPAAPAALES